MKFIVLLFLVNSFLWKMAYEFYHLQCARIVVFVLNVCCTVANACVVKELMSNLEQHVMAKCSLYFLKGSTVYYIGHFLELYVEPLRLLENLNVTSDHLLDYNNDHHSQRTSLGITAVDSVVCVAHTGLDRYLQVP